MKIEAVSFKDGDPLPGGKVVSLKGGYCVAVYRCGCGREQMAECEGFTGGVGVGIAQTVGWAYADGGWMCPDCSGDASKLFQIFKQ